MALHMIGEQPEHRSDVEQAQIVGSLTCKAWAEMACDVGLLQVHV